MKVESLLNRNVFYLTMVYAFNGAQEREPLWAHLRRISHLVNGPWAIAGDFNCVLSAAERIGGNSPSSEMDSFRACVDDCGVIDITSVGSVFTWNNKQKPEARIYSRLDRFLINKDWSDHMPDAYAHFLPEGLYDHTPCIVSQSQQVKCKGSFKYFNMWGGSANFLPTIRRNWDRALPGNHMFKLAKNLKLLKPALKELNRDRFSNIEQATNILQREVRCCLEDIGKDPSNLQLIEEEFRAIQELKELSEARDKFLAKKSKQVWIQDGDANSAFFHGMLKKRRAGNKVIMVEDMNGNLCDSPAKIQSAFLEYYQQLLGTSQETSKVHKRIID
ncbi:uncharacterized protein LOC141655273 [Silene latifolia]|uniref:uncharacterized protein LOC141655273 n=1 Tax=Silene latifolia TaxID=37657 RepID=UPI003D77916D